MNTSPTTKTIIPLLFDLQTELEAVVKEGINPHFHSTYADLNSVMDECKTKLNNRSIFVLQPIGHDEHGDYLETILVHAPTGEYISSQMRLVATTDAQKQGSAITYARRYSLQSLLFMQAVDDDGNIASQPVKPTTQAPTPTKTVVTQKALEEEAKQHGPCPDCGSPMRVSSKGNVVCSEACWLKGNKA